MRVILVSDVPGVGLKGDVLEVAPGHARNYLLPRKLAVPSSPAAEKRAEGIRKARQEAEARARAEAEAQARRAPYGYPPPPERSPYPQAPRRPAGRSRDTLIEAMAKSAARSVGSSLGRQILRGVLGSILGGKR